MAVIDHRNLTAVGHTVYAWGGRGEVGSYQ
jgi:hypothetical protein